MNSTMSPSLSPTTPEPLSWREARIRMRDLLKEYLLDKNSISTPLFLPLPSNEADSSHNENIVHHCDRFSSDDNNDVAVNCDDGDDGANDETKETTNRWKPWSSQWFHHDMDLYCGSVFFSIVMLLISAILIHRAISKRDNGDYGNKNSATGEQTWDTQRHEVVNCHRSQLLGSVLLLVGSLASTWVVRRRRFVAHRDEDIKKRNAVYSLLRVLDELLVQDDKDNDDFGKNEAKSSGCSHPFRFERTESAQDMLGVRLLGNSLGDIYSVYRFKSCVGQNGDLPAAGWHRIPSLLLVDGDFIALQNGDIAPSDCTLVTSTNNINDFVTESNADATASTIVRAGETIQPLKSELKSRPPNVCHPSFPPGRSSLSTKDSKKTLNLCRNAKVFMVTKAPLVNFLRREQVSHQPPQLHCKITKIRSSLFLLAILIFIITMMLILLRHSVGGNSLLTTWHLPFLATLAVMPVTTPLVLFLSEIVGCSRILTSATENNDASSSSRNLNRWLFLRYILLGIRSRISRFVVSSKKGRVSLFNESGDGDNTIKESITDSTVLFDFPPASNCLFERLGVVTALALVDDELVCEPTSKPQQLLIPSSNGLKLLDLFPKFDGDNSLNSECNGGVGESSSSPPSSDDSDDDCGNRGEEVDQIKGGGGNSRKRHNLVKRLRRMYLAGNEKRKGASYNSSSSHDNNDKFGGSGLHHATQEDNEVQFEDPNWWHHLPSLKCIGLGCLLMNDVNKNDNFNDVNSDDMGDFSTTIIPAASTPQQQICSKSRKNTTGKHYHNSIEGSLANHIRLFNPRHHLDSLSSCIGFSTKPNSFGARGDITPFQERRRVHVVATRLLHQRMQQDRHAISIEESRAWGTLHPDSTSVLVQDFRSGSLSSSFSSNPVATVTGVGKLNNSGSISSNSNNINANSSNNNNAKYQLLTLGDARVVVDFCSDSWQGENSTITPLSTKDRLAILESQKNWSLADLEVTAFSYAPIPPSHEQRLFDDRRDGRGGKHNAIKTTYLVDNKTNSDPEKVNSVDIQHSDWSLMRNQIFLGLLGSSVGPRKEIFWVTDVCSEAGIRFAYFSPRNMRRTKELASQMGIEVSWNCAISLRPLDEGEEADVWDVNARLPHGVADVKKHLKEVDNVPLLVSIFTDVTKHTTAEMVNVFQNYSDTVLAMGLSHVSFNDEIFSNSDLSIGISLFEENSRGQKSNSKLISKKDKRFYQNDLDPAEVDSVCSIAAHSCVFIMSLKMGLLHLSDVLSEGRAALNAGTSAGHFMVTSYLAFSFFVLMSTCSVATVIPFIPPIGSSLFLQLLVPLVSLAMNFTESNGEVMGSVPPKNDKSIIFADGEKRRLYTYAVLRAIPPAIFSQLIYLIAMGCLMMELEQDFLVNNNCPSKNWFLIIRCKALKKYSGDVSILAGRLMLAELALCTIVLSSTFVYRLIPLRTILPWKMNFIWIVTTVLCIGLVMIYLIITIDGGMLAKLPWYFYLVSFCLPFICVVPSEMVKARDILHEKRADMLRRLQFETRLGMWSPK